MYAGPGQTCRYDLKEKMSIFNWFSSKQPAKTVSGTEKSNLRQGNASVPVMLSDRLRVKPLAPPVRHAANHKTERLERRQYLYSVVRDSMIRAGVLAASYKFKVLSLDARGRQYLIMIDLANQSVGDTARLAEIEDMMAHSAKMRHDIRIKAVYWRVNEHVTAGLSPSPSVPAPQAPSAVQASSLPAIPVPLVMPEPRYEPLQQNEVSAFKRALASAAPAAPLSASGQIVTSGRRNPAPPVEFQDTQMVDPGERISPLSITQYGDLN